MIITSAQTQLETDLAKSGLTLVDVDAYPAEPAELTAVGLKPNLYLTPSETMVTPGYVLPYYDIQGMRAPFYRIRLFNPPPKGAKYLQPSNVGSWVYFPKFFGPVLKKQLASGQKPTIIITEGEKKAAKAMQEGFLTVGLGGVYNWRSTTIVFPEGTELARNRNSEIVAKVKGGLGQTPTIDHRGVLANGLQQLINLVKQYELTFVITFDSDFPPNPDVQKAAAELAFEFRSNGIPMQRIRQVELSTTTQTKIGLDDYIVKYGADSFRSLITAAIESRSAYPAHPNLKEVIGRKLDGPLERNEVREMALMIVSDMDRNGIRMTEKVLGTPYYFDNRTKVLMPVNLLHHHEQPLHETRFGEFLYRQYDVAQADHKLMGWLAAAFTGEQPVEKVEPRSTIAVNEQGLAYQIDDGHYIQITNNPAVPAMIRTNGSEGLLFKAGQVEPIDGQQLLSKFIEQLKWIKSNPSWDDYPWVKATKQFKFLRPHDARIMAVLSYMSPWLQRWNGTQLPVELMIGEPGSGKSSMYTLRMQILTGRSALRNQSTDIRDWYASITSQDGIHVTDNVAFASKELKQRISDEICRLVTEPIPTVEMRQLFTTSDNIRIPVRTTFAMTAIQQPFVNADIMQRSIIMELSAIGDNHSSDWAGTALKSFGGRVGWLAHQLAMIHVFLTYAKIEWRPEYPSKHRLANFEQMFSVFGSLMNMPDFAEVMKTLSDSSQAQVSEHDWTMEALKGYVLAMLANKTPPKAVTCHDISMWAEAQEDFVENQVVTNPRRLARYIKAHQYMVEKLAGLRETSKYGNRQMFAISPPQ